MFYLGMDIAKAKLDCCLLLNEAGDKHKSKVIPNTKAGVTALLEWAAKQGVSAAQLHVIMDATGVYHEQAALALVDAGVMVSIINPAQVKDFGRGLAIRTKTDGVDSVVLARYEALLKPAAWQPPPMEVRALQALLARRAAVADDLRRELNRREKSEAIETPELIVQSIAQSIAFLETELKRLQRAIDDHIDQHPGLKRDMTLLTSIPAVGERVGNNLLAIMHGNRFESAEQVAAYLGLAHRTAVWEHGVLGRASIVESRPSASAGSAIHGGSGCQTITTHMSRHFMNAYSPEANPRCLLSVLLYASWCICAPALSKRNALTTQIIQKLLDLKDGIYDL